MAAREHAGGGVKAADLISFEREVATAIDAGRVPGPTHLSGGNEEQLIDIFRNVARYDWVFSTYRNHYHALLHGVPRESVMSEVMAGRSMNLAFQSPRFLTSAIVGGCLSIAVGAAAALKRGSMLGGALMQRRVFCFVGDMAATTGAFHEASSYASLQDLPITFVVEDNGLATDTPTDECWGQSFHGWFESSMAAVIGDKVIRYKYERTYPHIGTQPRGTL